MNGRSLISDDVLEPRTSEELRERARRSLKSADPSFCKHSWVPETLERDGEQFVVETIACVACGQRRDLPDGDSV